MAVVIGPEGPRKPSEGAEPGDIFVWHSKGYVGRVMQAIRAGEINTWGQKIMPLNPWDWKEDDLARAHPFPTQMRKPPHADFDKAEGA